MTTDPPTHDTLAAALSALQGEMRPIGKSNRASVQSKKGAGSSYSYTYADLADIMVELGPALGRHGLAWTALTHRTETSWVLTVRLMHAGSTDTIESSLPITTIGGDITALGSEQTYLRRYLLLGVTGLVTGDDDDGRSVPQQRPQQQAQRPQQRPEPRQQEPAHLSDDDRTPLLSRVQQLIGDYPPGDERSPYVRQLWDVAREGHLLDHVTPAPAWLDPEGGPVSVRVLLTQAITHDPYATTDTTEQTA